MDKKTINQLAKDLYQALEDRSVIDPPSSLYPSLTIDDAYLVSLRFLENRLAGGGNIVGRKIGLTNQKMQRYFGISEPGFGYLLDTMVYPCGGDIPVSDLLIQPKIEGEIAFILGDAIEGPGVTEAEVLVATEFVTPCFELADSRIRRWEINVLDFAADNGCGGLFVMSESRIDPKSLDLPSCKMILKENDHIVSEGQGTEVLGSPAKCVAWLANKLGRLEAGDIVLSGSLGSVIDARRDAELELSISGMGAVTIRLT